MVQFNVDIYDIINILDKNIYKMNIKTKWYPDKRDITACFYELNFELNQNDLEKFVDEF